MTQAMTVRLDPGTQHKLDDLARWGGTTKSAVVKDAITRAWQTCQDLALDAAYANAAHNNPHYPYDDADEATTLRHRRNRRQAAAHTR